MPENTTDTVDHREAIHALLGYLDASPTPWHAVARAEALLQAAGFQRLEETARWQLEAPGRYYVTRGAASLIAFVLGQGPLAETGFRIVGAHTDSPGLRLKPRPGLDGDGLWRLAVEVYGGPILASFADRDLGLAGRLMVRTADGPVAHLVHFDKPLLRLPNLAIHMNREVNEQGLKFNRQSELPLVLGLATAGREAEPQLRDLLAAAAQVEVWDILSWDLVAHDLQPASLWGAADEFIASGRIDNLASCHAAVQALITSPAAAPTCVVALFDHEEVGSGSATGAGGSFAADILQRLCLHAGLDGEDRHRAMAASFFVSADAAHAYQPNFPAAYEPGHKVMVNGGPVIKTHVGQRYTTQADTAARFMDLCEQAGVPYQQYAHRADLACGSTIGPILAAGLGIPGVDVGAAMWAMHSARESAGARDQAYMIAALQALFTH